MLLPSTITQHQSAASTSGTCKSGSASLGVNLRVSTFRPPNVTRTSIVQKRRAANVTAVQAAEILAVPEPEKLNAYEEKRKIAIFVEPSPFSHVSGNFIMVAPSISSKNARSHRSLLVESQGCWLMLALKVSGTFPECMSCNFGTACWPACAFGRNSDVTLVVFAWAGMKIRFSNLIKGLRQIGDDVMVVTPCINPPKTFHGAKVRRSRDTLA